MRGAAVGDVEPVSQVEFATAGGVIHTAACDAPRPALAAERPDLPGAEASGFYATLGALDLLREFELRVRAVLADGDACPARRDHRPPRARCGRPSTRACSR